MVPVLGSGAVSLVLLVFQGQCGKQSQGRAPGALSQQTQEMHWLVLPVTGPDTVSEII